MSEIRADASPGDVLKGKHVMVVEDSGVLCCMLVEILRGAGCTLAGPYTHVEEAIEAARTSDLDAALLDIRVRGQLVSPVAQELDRRSVPILLTSAYHVEDIPRSLRHAAFLRKPFTEDDVLERLTTLLTPRSLAMHT
jgi:DNA-binding response OmpR family regulator